MKERIQKGKKTPKQTEGIKNQLYFTVAILVPKRACIVD